MPLLFELVTVAWRRKSAKKTRTQQLVLVPRSDSDLFLSSQGRVACRVGRGGQKGPFGALICFEQISVAPVSAADSDTERLNTMSLDLSQNALYRPEISQTFAQFPPVRHHCSGGQNKRRYELFYEITNRCSYMQYILYHC